MLTSKASTPYLTLFAAKSQTKKTAQPRGESRFLISTIFPLKIHQNPQNAVDYGQSDANPGQKRMRL
jgi:hypothetical protein